MAAKHRVAIIVLDEMGDITVISSVRYPLGAMAISGALLEAGFESEVFAQSHYTGENWREKLIADVVLFNPHVIGFSTMTFNWEASCRLAEELQAMLHAPIIFGGWHVSGIFWHYQQGHKYPDLWQEFIDHEDWYAVVGEGYISAIELIHALRYTSDPRKIDGIAYGRNGKIVATRPQGRISDGNCWPVFDRRKFQPMQAIGLAGKSNPQVMTMSGAGCRFHCKNCQTPTACPGGPVRRSPRNFVDELERLTSQNETAVLDLFEDFTGDLDWVESICHEIRRRKLDISWGSFGNVADFAKDWDRAAQILNLMRLSGHSNALMIGIESASPSTLKKLGRPNSFDQISRFAHLAKYTGVPVYATVMVGYPWEEYKELIDSLEQIIALPIDYLNICTLMPFPGTQLYVDCRENGLIRGDASFSDYTGSRQIIKSPIESELLERTRLKYLYRFYEQRSNDPNYRDFMEGLFIQEIGRRLDKKA